jgi:type IV conjugative transfer system protein TraL
MEDISTYTVLKTLDNAPRFLFWDMDEFVLMVAPFILGMSISIFIMPLGFILRYFYSKLKKRYSHGKLKHKLYRSLPKQLFEVVGVCGRCPPSHLRKFIV